MKSHKTAIKWTFSVNLWPLERWYTGLLRDKRITPDCLLQLFRNVLVFPLTRAVCINACNALSVHTLTHTRQHSIHFFFHFRHKQKSSQCLPNSKHVYLYIYWNSQFFNVNIWNCARHIAFQHTHFIKACLTGPMLCDSSVSPCMLFSFIFFPFVVRCAETIKHSTDCCRNPAHYVYCWRLCVWAYQKPELEWQHLLFWCCNIHVGALFLLFSVCFSVCVMSATLG